MARRKITVSPINNILNTQRSCTEQKLNGAENKDMAEEAGFTTPQINHENLIMELLRIGEYLDSSSIERLNKETFPEWCLLM